MEKVTLVAIMLNEEYFLPRFIENVKGIFDDYKFVDGGSTDKSVEIAVGAGITVGENPFRLDFAAQKNFALSLSNTNWTMILDIDELLSRGLKKYIVNLKNKDYAPEFQPMGFAFFRDNFLDGGGQDDAPLDFPVRLFWNWKGIHYVGKVHEQPTGMKNIVHCLDGRIYHMKDSFRQYRANLLYELIRRGETELPPPDDGAFEEDGRLRKVKLLPDRKIEVLDEWIEGPLLNK